MLKVMIVDDEYIVREDLKMIMNWGDNGYTIVAEAKDGRQGIELYNKYHPHIIISDIKMPGMDGLNMVKEIRKLSSEVKFILLTSYNDFDYAREAITYGVKSYLLKHEIDSILLQTELENIRKTIKEEINLDRYSRKQILRKLLLGEYESIEEQESITNYHINFTGKTAVLFIMEVDGYWIRQEEVNGVSLLSRKNRFIESLNYLIKEDYHSDIIEMDENRYVAIIYLPLTINRAGIQKIMAQLSSEYQLHSRKLLGYTITISVSDAIDHVSKLKGGYIKALEILKMKVFEIRESTFYSYSFNDLKIEKETEKSKKILEQFEESIKISDYINAGSCLKFLFTDFLVKQHDLDMLKKSTDRVVNILHNIFMRIDSDIFVKYTNIIGMYADIDKLDNIYKIYDWFIELINQISVIEERSFTRKIRDIIKYVHKNYNKDITLQDLADQLGISRIYASQLFKKEVGESFKTYLTNYRILKAKELLESGKYRIYEVSEMVGYQTVQYFCQTFRRVMGTNPKEFINN